MSEGMDLVPEPAEAGSWVVEASDMLQEWLEETLRWVDSNGFLTLGNAKPAERWAFFQQRTHPQDWAHILDETYIEQRKLGLAPVFEAELIMREYAVQVQQAATTGLPVAPEPIYAFPWPVALSDGTASIVYELLAADARNLYRQNVRKALEAMAL